MPQAPITEFAPAKVNLTLHVTGQRADGYHLLDSLVVFADIGDTITAMPAPSLTLHITGPQAATIPKGDDNLVMRAARLIGGTAKLTLHKRLPIASGIGGGSADAAATLRALSRLHNRPLPDAAALGADLPVCLHNRPTRMQGTGEALLPAPDLPPAWLVLVNPGIPTHTPAVFRAMTRRNNAPMQLRLPTLHTATGLADFLHQTRNDMEPAALTLCPAIATVTAALTAQPGCLVARMSGSGATCFGLFATEHHAATAQKALKIAQPSWWAACGALLP